MSHGELTAGLQLRSEEGRPWTSRIVAVYDDIAELHAEGYMAIMLENGMVFTVVRDKKWAVKAKVRVQAIKFKRPGDAIPHPLLYPIISE
jgi:hypothetical protein